MSSEYLSGQYGKLLCSSASCDWTNVPDVPKKVKRLFDHRTKGFCSIIKFFAFDFNTKKHFNLDFETKFTQIQHELTGIHQFQN